VVTAILAIAPVRERRSGGSDHIELDDTERDAVNTLAAAGLVPPLRLVSGMSVNQDIA
jgi:hypothetical protein